MGLSLERLKEIFGEDFVPRDPKEVAQEELDRVINEIMELGLSNKALTQEEKLDKATDLFGAGARALRLGLITPEDNYQLYMWVTGLLRI